MSFSRRTENVLIAIAFVIGIAVGAATRFQAGHDLTWAICGALWIPVLGWTIGMRQHAAAGLMFALGVSVGWEAKELILVTDPRPWWLSLMRVAGLYSFVGVFAFAVSSVCAFLSWLARRIRK